MSALFRLPPSSRGRRWRVSRSVPSSGLQRGTRRRRKPRAARPAVAYNSQANGYLVVFRADGLATDDEDEVFGQRLSASGEELGGDFRIPTWAPTATPIATRYSRAWPTTLRPTSTRGLGGRRARHRRRVLRSSDSGFQRRGHSSAETSDSNVGTTATRIAMRLNRRSPTTCRRTSSLVVFRGDGRRHRRRVRDLRTAGFGARGHRSAETSES